MNLKKLTRPKILKMDLVTLSIRVTELMNWETKLGATGVYTPDYLTNLNDTFDILNKLSTDGHVILIEFPTKDDPKFYVKRFMEFDGEWIWDSIHGNTIQEAILRTVLLAHIPKHRQKLSVKKIKN